MWIVGIRGSGTLSALIFAGLNVRMTKISCELIRVIWLNSRKFAKYTSLEISRELQTTKIAKSKYHEITQKRHKRLAYQSRNSRNLNPRN